MTSLKNINKNKLLLNLHIYLHKVVFSLTNIVVVLEKNAKRELINYWLVKNEKIMIIPNFVDFKKIKFLSKSKINIREKEKILKNKVIINVGRLHSQKNHSLLIRAFHLVKKRFKKVILLIIGSGQEKNTLKELVKKLGLNDSVFILENEDNPFKYLALSDVFVLSSRFEGFGIVLLESLFFGLPIVSTDCSYSIKHIIAPELSIDKLPNIYMNDYGTIISEKSEQTTKLMADRIKYYLNNKISNSIKVKKIKRALGFSKDKILPMWVKILNGLFT